MKRKKSNKFQLLISSAALLLILLVAAGVTYSWIEGGTTYSIITENSNDVKTGTAPVKPIANSLKITPGSTETIVNLNDFDKTTNNTQGLYFSEVSSSDGENFYFPSAYNEGGTAKAYRAANTNDIGTKFIKYDFDVTASKTCYLAFAETPTITATKDGSEISDTSAFRIMLKCDDKKLFLTTADTEQTSNAVTNIGGATTALTAEPVEKYVYRHDDSVQMFKFNQNETKNIEVSVWLDAEKASSALIGAKVDLNMKLKVDQALVKTKVYVESRGYDTHYGYVYTDNNKTEFDKWPGKLMTFVSNTGYYCVEGRLSENAYFIVNNGLNNYQEGAAQYPPKDSDILKDLVIDISGEKDVNGFITYVLKKDGKWHRFDDTEITVNAHSVAFDNDGTTEQSPEASKGTVSIDASTGAVSASKVVYQDTSAGTDVTLTASAGANYEFAGWYSDSGCSAESLITDKLTYTYNANKTDRTYKDLYAKFVEKPKYTVTFDAVTYDNNNNKLENGFTGGKIDSKTASYEVTKYRDEKVEATATANTNYTFKGWYTDPGCTINVETANKLSKPLDSNSNDITYYAKFVEKPKHTVAVYAKTYPTGKFADGVGGTVTVNDSPSSVEVYEGSTVTINATANTAENFRFEGWYTDSTCTTKLDGANYSQAEKTVTVGKEDPQNYYAKFVKQYEVTFKSVLAGGTESSDCATLKINNETVSPKTVDYNTEVTLSAEAKGTYVFKKIYKIVDGLKVEVSTTSPTTVTINDDITYFAEFDSKPPVTTTIYFEPRNDFKISKAYVFNLDTKKKKYTADWPGDAVTYDKELGLYVYSFETTDEGQFGVVVNNGSSDMQYPANEHQLVGDIGGTYIFRNEKYTYTFDKNNNANLETIKIVNVSVTPKTYPGDLEAAAGGTAKASVSKGYSGKEITLTATPNTGFRFAGWYTNKDCTDEYKVSDTDNENTSLKVTLGDTDVTYFAKFVKQVTVELKVRTDGADSSAGGKVSIDAGTSFSTSANATVDIGDSTSILPATMFVAQANNGYQFESWYDENNNKIVLPNAIEVTKDITYYANFVTLNSVTLKVKTDGTVGGEGGQVSVDGGTNYDSTSASIDVVTGGTFTPSEIFAQRANDGYEFEGWYDSNNNKIDPLPATPVIVSSSMIYYANFKTKESTVNCYLMGDVNVNESDNDRWNVNVNTDSKIMTDNGDGTYSKTVTLSANLPYEFKVIEKDSKNITTWYGTDGGTVAINGTYTDFNKTSGNNAKMTTTSAGDYIFTYNQKEHKIKIKAPKSTKVDLPPEALPTTSKIAANTLIFNFGLSEPTGCIWYWPDKSSGVVRNTTQYAGTSTTVSTYTFTDGTTKPNAIALAGTATEGDTNFPSNKKQNDNDITNDANISGPYYISKTDAKQWSSFTHLTPSLTVSPATVNVNSPVTLSASVNGTLFNSNTKYTFYVQKDGVTYRASELKTTSNTCTWTPNVAGTYTVYVATYDEFGIETVVSNPETVTVN